jgi:hypothetical protein
MTINSTKHEAKHEAKDEALVAALSSAARADADAELHATGGPASAVWHRVRQARAGRVDRRRWRLGVAVATAALACGLGAWALRRPPALTYVVTGAEVEANGYVRASTSMPTELHFSDGTRVRLAHGARLSVGAPGPHGARLRVEDGEAHFEVEHLRGSDWSVEAGPYHVAVTGTVFDLSWTGADETAVVTMQAGSVVVTGPQLAAPIRLTSGQRFAAQVASGQIRIDRIDRAAPAPAAPAAPTPPPAEVPAPVGAPAPAHAARVPAAPRLHAERWSHRVASGDATAVLTEARARGLDTVVAGVDDEALAALADAARYSGARDVSTRALEELRRRFPSSARAPAAAFLLGRLADDAGGTSAALAWYRTYAAEAPRGPYAAESLGRAMLAIERLSGRAAAATVAHDYLARFPDGTYLLQARAILGLP